ncbi:hypothetical protein CHUAL_006264 [Chamberlinius hualienensis]
MAMAVDQAKFLTDKLIDNLNKMRDILSVIGLFYTTKLGVQMVNSVLNGMKTFVFPIIRPTNIRKFGKWAVVTGCTDGIGKAYCQVLAKKGFNIVLISRNLEKLKSNAHFLESNFGISTIVISADFSEGNQIYQNIKDQLAKLDIGILVNNVGVMSERPMKFNELSTESLWEHVLVNVGAVTMMTNIVLPQMIKNGRGAIINISSASCIYPLPLMAVYSATKAYVDYLSRAMQEEYRNSGIIIQCLMPFYVATGMTKFSPTLHQYKWFVPEALTYVNHALTTLGYSKRTTGYWSHGLQYLLMGHVPEWVWMKAGRLIQLFLRKDSSGPKKRSRFMGEFLPPTEEN